MNPLLKNVAIIVISSAIFTIILNGLYKSNSKLLSFVYKMPRAWKGKYLMRWMVLLSLMLLISVVVVIGGLNETVGTILVGFFISLTDLIFGKSIRKK